MTATSLVRLARLSGLLPVERALVTGSLADALRVAVEAADGDARATVRPVSL